MMYHELMTKHEDEWNKADEIARLRMGLHHAVGYLQHFKEDAECKLVSYPDSIQRAIDDIKGVLNGGQAGDAYRALQLS